MTGPVDDYKYMSIQSVELAVAKNKTKKQVANKSRLIYEYSRSTKYRSKITCFFDTPRYAEKHYCGANTLTPNG